MKKLGDRSKKHAKEELLAENEATETLDIVEQVDNENSTEDVKPDADLTVNEMSLESKSKLTRRSRLKAWVLKHRRKTAALFVVLLIVILGLIPWTRFKIVGLVLKQQFQVSVVDSQTKLPVSKALVVLDGKSAETNNKGIASVKVPVGKHALVVSKLYYREFSSNVTNPIVKQKHKFAISLQATGRQVPITVINAVDGTPVDDATVKAAGTSAETNSFGKVTVVLPADKKTVSLVVDASGYNSTTDTSTVTPNIVSQNTFRLVPSGRVYYLSNITGKINVDSVNLDGSDPQVVLAGTGYETADNIQMYVSPDQKYIALLAQRTSSTTTSALYLVNTSKDSVSTMDQGTDTDFKVIGWIGDTFAYQTSQNGTSNTQKNAIKMFNATGSTPTTLSSISTDGTTPAYQQYSDQAYLSGNSIIYAKSWNISVNDGTLSNTENDNILSSNVHTAVTSDLQDISNANVTSSYIASIQTGPDTIYFQTQDYNNQGNNPPDAYYKYNNGTVSQLSGFTGANYNELTSGTNTYIGLSPNGDSSLYNDNINGQTTVVIGDSSGNNQNKVATLSSDYQVVGWLSNNYILLSYKNNEYEVVSTKGLPSGSTPLKITNYLPTYYNQYQY